jgi:hypothetical protein
MSRDEIKIFSNLGDTVMTEIYMSEHFGTWQVGDDPNQGAVDFKLFFPNASQHENKGETYGGF